MRPATRVSALLKRKQPKEQVIGCFPPYPPVELFAAMGALPSVLWNLRGSLDDFTKADEHVQNYACGIARELVQFHLSEAGSLVDGIFSYNACDTLRNTPEIIAAANIEAGRAIHMLRMHVPQVDRSQSNPDRYLRKEIARLIEAVEIAFDTRFSPERFFQTTKRYGQMRALCREAESLVAQGRLSFGAFCGVVLQGHLLPVKEQIENLTGLIATGNGRKSGAGKRVLVSGIMPPPAPVVRAMEASGLCVAANDIASLARSYAYSPAATEDPGDYYLDFFANRFPCTTLLYRADDRVEAFLRLVTDARARGVIFSGEKFCEHEYFEFPYLEKRLRALSIPTLFLEFSVDDAENIGAYATRLEAFAEMIEP